MAQTERAAELQKVLDGLNFFANNSGYKGKAITAGMAAYVAGYVEGKGGTPDPILYYSVARGGDPRKEIENGIKLIS
jgi:hypothetical protein